MIRLCRMNKMVKGIEILTWVATKDGEVVGTFPTRKSAVKWIKGLLAQTLKDLSPQDKTDEFDYEISISKYEIKCVKNRSIFLGL